MRRMNRVWGNARKRSWSIDIGETVFITGPNECGKTTVINSIRMALFGTDGRVSATRPSDVVAAYGDGCRFGVSFTDGVSIERSFRGDKTDLSVIGIQTSKGGVREKNAAILVYLGTAEPWPTVSDLTGRLQNQSELNSYLMALCDPVEGVDTDITAALLDKFGLEAPSKLAAPSGYDAALEWLSGVRSEASAKVSANQTTATNNVKTIDEIKAATESISQDDIDALEAEIAKLNAAIALAKEAAKTREAEAVELARLRAEHAGFESIEEVDLAAARAAHEAAVAEENAKIAAETAAALSAANEARHVAEELEAQRDTARDAMADVKSKLDTDRTRAESFTEITHRIVAVRTEVADPSLDEAFGKIIEYILSAAEDAGKRAEILVADYAAKAEAFAKAEGDLRDAKAALGEADKKHAACVAAKPDRNPVVAKLAADVDRAAAAFDRREKAISRKAVVEARIAYLEERATAELPDAESMVSDHDAAVARLTSHRAVLARRRSIVELEAQRAAAVTAIEDGEKAHASAGDAIKWVTEQRTHYLSAALSSFVETANSFLTGVMGCDFSVRPVVYQKKTIPDVGIVRDGTYISFENLSRGALLVFAIAFFAATSKRKGGISPLIIDDMDGVSEDRFQEAINTALAAVSSGCVTQAFLAGHAHPKRDDIAVVTL